jgi:hypothetical protein
VSADVVDLSARRLEKSPHRAGYARCLNCKHEWSAVAPIGVTTLECSQCRTFQGVFLGVATTQRLQWQCVCGEFTFFIDEFSPYCAHCGVRPAHYNLS